MRHFVWISCLLLSAVVYAEKPIPAEPLVDMPDDPAAEMVAGIDRFLLQQWKTAREKQQAFWHTPQQVAENREVLKQIVGLEIQRFPAADGMLRSPKPLIRDKSFAAWPVRWPVLPSPAPQTANTAGLWGEGIHLAPKKACKSLVIVIPDADELPERWLPLGLELFVGESSWRNKFAVELVDAGSDVVLMSTVSRKIHQHGRAKLSRREYLHRSAFELGRTLTGYEIQMVQSIIDQFPGYEQIAVCGVGEGGRTALLVGALDTRIGVVATGDYFGSHGPLWNEPLSRQLFGIRNRFSDGTIAALISPRYFAAFHDADYQVKLPGDGGAPADWKSSDKATLNDQLNDFLSVAERTETEHPFVYQSRNFDLRVVLEKRWTDLPKRTRDAESTLLKVLMKPEAVKQNAQRRGERMLDSIDAYNQTLLAESVYERREYVNLDHPKHDAKDGSNRLDTSSPRDFRESAKRFRDDFRENVIGWFDDERLPLNARSMKRIENEKWVGHDVVLDVFPDVFAYGILLMPRDIAPGEKRPVVVCQHGLEGRPMDTIAGDHRAYHDFAAKLAEEGYIVFAPQNPYVGRDEFRTLQRKAYPLAKTLFSVIGAQHEAILEWLKTMPNVDSEAIAFYGLSYGGKSAMRLPALLPDYCLAICSADFNDWVWKNASSRAPYSYIGTGEYEIFEFGLGKKFNYAEMAALIAPRPFMVERGHFDGVAPDHLVASEFAKVRYLYQARLKLQDRCRIEFFDGPHTINGKGTFDFLRTHVPIDKP